jgi:hypothetical protein
MTGLLGSACSISGGFVRDGRGSQPFDLRMDVGGVQYLKTVSGTAESASVLCAIPLEGGVYDRAMRALNTSARLANNQIVANLREDHSVRTYLLYCVHTVTISGDVLELSPARASVPAAFPLTGFERTAAILSDNLIEPDWDEPDVYSTVPKPKSVGSPKPVRDDSAAESPGEDPLSPLE